MNSYAGLPKNTATGEIIAAFKSGISKDGGGVTVALEERTVDGIVYMDTPGLADKKIEKEAAEAIRDALRKTGSYRIFFMVRSESGRISCEDLTTIHRVISIIKKDKDDLQFSVIVNKVKPKIYKSMFDVTYKDYDQQMLNSLVQLIRVGEHKSSHIYFMPVVDELDDENDAVADLPEDFRQFVEDAPRVKIDNKEMISDISTHEEELQRLRNEMDAKVRHMEAELRRASSSSALQYLIPIVGQIKFLSDVGKEVYDGVGKAMEDSGVSSVLRQTGIAQATGKIFGI
jgi:hypothetical protein